MKYMEIQIKQKVNDEIYMRIVEGNVELEKGMGSPLMFSNNVIGVVKNIAFDNETKEIIINATMIGNCFLEFARDVNFVVDDDKLIKIIVNEERLILSGVELDFNSKEKG